MSEGQRLSIFPLPGALLFPRAQLPLHIFEPRYRALVTDALARDRRIGMIQPRGSGERSPLFEVGCIGHIAHVEALEDGRFNIILDGLTRFRLMEERDVATPFRQITASTADWDDDNEPGPLASVRRAAVEEEAKLFARALDFTVDWDGVGQLDDETLVNAIAQVVPFDVGIKQALLETRELDERADLLVQALAFARAGKGDGATLQ